MKMRTARLVRRVRTDEEGAALASVIGLAVVMMLMVAMTMAFSTSGLVKSRSDQDSNAALAAAYAGVDEYTSRLSNDSTYQKYGNPVAPFTVRTGSASTVTAPTGLDANPAFAVGAAGTWAPLAGSGGRATFRYEVDNSLYSAQGTIRIRSTGRVGNETRSVVANVRQKGFLEFLYFTEYELMDPLVTNQACTPSRAPHNSGCVEIQFGASDVMRGKIHSNDTLRICKSTFEEQVSSSNTPLYVAGCTGSISWAPGATGPVAAAPLPMPSTNASMANETRVDLPRDVPRPGCMYTGPTTITFTDDGKMRVVSPWTRVTQPSLTAGISSQSPAACGAITALNSAAGALVDVPDQNLIFVQNVPTATTDPNYRNPAAPPANFSCTGTGATAGWTYGSPVAFRYPMTNEVIPPSSTSVAPAYKCTNGDVFVKGKVKGAVTVAASNYVYVTGDLTYADSGVDVLGLVGQNAVWVWNPMKSCSGTYDLLDNRHRTCTVMPPADTDRPAVRTIQAAILSVGHTFQVQNFDTGAARGTLEILGAIAQTYRGTVAWNDGSGNATGYIKDYDYDERLVTAAPPKFLTPTSTTYGVTKFVDVARAFAADGTAVPLP